MALTIMKLTKFSVMATSVLFCVAAFGAIPTFDSFDTNYFSSNNFKISLKTSNLPGGSNQTAVQYLSIQTTNESYGYTDTNTIYITLAGSAGVSGFYTNKSRTADNHDVWTNAAGTFGVFHDPDGSAGDNAWMITNSAGSILYDADAQGNSLGLVPGESWTRQAGVNPAPTVKYGTNTATKALYYPSPASMLPIPMYLQTNCLFIMTNGDDLFGQRGRIDRPFKTLNYCLTNAARSGDTIFVLNGRYDVSDIPFATLGKNLNNLSVLGAGRGSTFLDGAGSQTKFAIGTSNYWAHFTSANCWYYGVGGNSGNSTNGMIEDIDASGVGDVVVAQNSTFGMRIRNCRLNGNSDKVADLSTLIGDATDYATNFFITIENCTVSGGNGQDGDGLNLLGGRLRKQLVNVASVVAGGTKIINSTTNQGNTLPGWTKRPQTIRTNFIDGQLYTNIYSVDIDVSCTISNVISGTAGASRHALWIYPQAGSGITGTTNFAGDYHQAVTATTNSVQLSGTVIAGQVYTFTNQTTGANNDSKIQIGSGTLKIP